jgi:CrcB protein
MIWYVAAGGAVGSVARYLLSTLLQERSGGVFPVGTLVVNVTGSLLLGLLLRYSLDAPAFSPEVRVLLATGFCGGYTTFSTFSYETARLMETGDYRRAVAYVVLSVGVSLAAMFAGFAAARALIAWRQGA